MSFKANSEVKSKSNQIIDYYFRKNKINGQINIQNERNE